MTQRPQIRSDARQGRCRQRRQPISRAASRLGAAVAAVVLTLLLFDGVAGLAAPGAEPDARLAVAARPLR